MKNIIGPWWPAFLCLLCGIAAVIYSWDSVNQIRKTKEAFFDVSIKFSEGGHRPRTPFPNPSIEQWEVFTASTGTKQDCGVVKWSELDSTILHQFSAFVTKDVRFYYNGSSFVESAVLQPRENCMPQSLGIKGLAFSVAPNDTADDSCKVVQGVWGLFRVHRYAQDNLFEELVRSLYPMFMTAVHLGIDFDHFRLTFVDGLPAGFLAFPDLYGAIGHYVPWKLLVGGGATVHRAKGCIQFETAIFAEAGYYWLHRPVVSGANKYLTRLVDKVIAHVGASGPSTCPPRILYVPRKRGYRRALNDEGIVEGIREVATGYDVMSQEMAELPFKEQVKVVRKSAIMVFMHGGTGPQVLWLPPLAVAIEMFPYKFADPMYRNMAVMTGKFWLGWQNKNLTAADWCGRPDLIGKKNRNTCTIVDISEVQHLVQVAMSLNSRVLTRMSPEGEPTTSIGCGN